MHPSTASSQTDIDPFAEDRHGDPGDGDALTVPFVDSRRARRSDVTLDVHVAALRLAGVDSTRRIADAHAPFLAVMNALQHLALTVHFTLLLRWHGQENDTFSGHLLIASPESRPDEVESLSRTVAALFATPASPWRLEHMSFDDLDLPKNGDVRFIRQGTMDVAIDESSWRVPIRFAHPGPGCWDRLIAAMRAIPSPVDLALTVTPTMLTPPEEKELERIAILEEQDGTGLYHQRLRATAADAVSSLRTAVSEMQIALVGHNLLDEVQVASIGGAISSPFHTAAGDGYQVAAPHRRMIGGFVADPARQPAQVLELLGAGCPFVHGDGRQLQDLVTADETSFLMSWPVGSDGQLPGVRRGDPLELVEPTSSSVDLGTVHGEDTTVHLDFRDRTQHFAFFGANGTGKTATLYHLLRQDVIAGRTLWIFDEPADLLRLIAHSVPEDRRERVVLLDCAGPSPHAINLLSLTPDPERNLDFAVAVHDGIVADLPTDFHGPMGRDNILAILYAYSAMQVPLCDLLRVFDEPAYASELAVSVAEALDELDDPDPRLRRSPAALLNLHKGNTNDSVSTVRWLRSKVPVLSDVAGVLGASAPTHHIDDLVAPGAIVLVRPPHDVDGSRLVSSMLLQVLASATTDRTVADHELVVCVDEVQRCAGSALRQVMNESRKRGVAVHVATQHLRNVDAEAEAILGNAGSVMTGRLRGRSAVSLAAELQLEARDVHRLRNGHLLGNVLQCGNPVGPVHLVVPDRPPAQPGWPDWLVSPG